jgi:hypothetical protein
MDRLVDDMVAEGTGLTRPQAMAYIEKIFGLIETYVAKGYRVNLPLISIYATVKGVFNGREDNFDELIHQVVIRVLAGQRLRRLEKSIKVKKVKSVSPMPDPQDFIDAATGEKNRTATPGGIANLKGYYLKFDLDDSGQGLFFISADNPQETFRVQQFTGVKPSELHFLIPPLPAGEYRVELRTKVRGGKNTRTGTLAEIIVVA